MIRNFGIIILLTLTIILSSCTDQREISNQEYYKKAQDYLAGKDYENSLLNFNLALEEGYNDQDGEVKNLISILENYQLSKELYGQQDMERASEKVYLIKDYQAYSIRDDVNKLKKDIYENMEDRDHTRVRYVDELLEEEVVQLKESANISLEEASLRLRSNLEKQVSLEGVEEFNIISEDALWYYFNAYDDEYEDEYEVSYYVNSKTGEVVEDRLYEDH